MKTKILALVLAMLMLISLDACNNNNNTTDETTGGTDTKEQGTQGTQGTNPGTETTGPNDTTETPGPGGETTVPDNALDHLPERYYDDDEFTVILRSKTNRYSLALIIEDLGTTPTSLDRAVYERMTHIEETYGLKFAVEEGEADKVANYAKGTNDQFELFGVHAQAGPWNLAINGQLYEWHDLELIDLDASYWSQNAREQFSTPGGKIFFLTGDMSYWTVGAAFCMFFNKDLIADVDGLESPYDVVRRDEWTFDVFSEYVTTLDSNMNGTNTGDIANDSFGYVSSNTRGNYQVMVTTKYPMLQKDEGEKYGYKVNVTKETFVNAVQAFLDLEDTGSVYLFHDINLGYQPLYDAFTSGRAAFYDDEVNFASQWSKSGMNFGVLPWPKYDEDTELYNSMVNAGNDSFGLPINTSDANAERISIVLENLAYYGQRDLMSLYYETILTYQYVKDVDSIEMIEDHIHEGLNFDFGYYYSPGGMIGLVAKCRTNNSSLSTEYGKIQGSVNDALKKWAELDEE